MKLRLLLLAIGSIMLLALGCSESPNINSPVDMETIQLVQRPDFIDTRPQEVQAAHLIDLSDGYVIESADKKPPKPPPEPDPPGEDPNPNPAHKYAYIVGISDYEGTINDLQYCDDDAMDMKQFLQGEGFSVQMDLDRNATADNIVAGLNWLAAQAEPGDEIFFYYSGHGNKVGGSGSCLISTDLYYISHGYVMNIFNSANCTKTMVAIDACKIGSFLSDGNDGSFIATASNNSYSYDAPDLQAGAWTYYFLEAANGSYVFAEEIAPYAEDGMKAWAKIWGVRVSPSHTDKYTGSLDI